MSLRVFAWDANPTVDRFMYRLSDKRAALVVAEFRGGYVTLPSGHKAIQLDPPPDIQQDRSSRNTLINFSRGAIGKTKHPPAINYPIPACGAHNPPTVTVAETYGL